MFAEGSDRGDISYFKEERVPKNRYVTRELEIRIRDEIR